jgi:hypothetical protein
MQRKHALLGCAINVRVTLTLIKVEEIAAADD